MAAWGADIGGATGGGGGGAPFVGAPFAGAEATLLTSYSVPTGGPATLHPEFSAPSPKITDANRLRSDSGAAQWWLFAGTPPSANYKVSVDITLVGESDSYSGVVVRTDPTAKTGVEARENAIGRYDLIKWVAGAFTLWENNVIASGTRLSVVANGDDFWMELDGVMIGSVHTDSGFPASGKAAITFFNGMTNTDGRHISNLIAAP